MHGVLVEGRILHHREPCVDLACGDLPSETVSGLAARQLEAPSVGLPGFVRREIATLNVAMGDLGTCEEAGHQESQQEAGEGPMFDVTLPSRIREGDSDKHHPHKFRTPTRITALVFRRCQ